MAQLVNNMLPLVSIILALCIMYIYIKKKNNFK